MATPTRGRTLKYLSVHEARYAIAAVARDDASGDVTEAVCLFCKHFGREQRADKKRKNSSTVKYFRDSFRPDQYTQHHQLQHPTQWKRYKSCSEEEKLQFFPVKNTTISTKLTTQQCTAAQTQEEPLIPNAEERGRCFNLKAEIVEVVAVLAQGIGLLNSTVETRDRRTYQYMLHHDAEEEEHTNCPRWSPPPDTFQSCELVQREPPVYRVVVYSKKQMDLLMEMAAQGLSVAQISQSLKVFRRHPSTLLGCVVRDAAKMLPILNRDPALTMENAKEKQLVIAMTPMYNHAQTAEFVRLGIATSMSIIARLMEGSWAFSLELCTVAQHSRYSYLDVRVKFYNRACGLRSAHLIAIPRYIGKCDLLMFQTLERVLTSVFPKWRKRLLGITTGGDIAIPARIDDLIRHFQDGASGPALHRANCCCKQLQRVLNTFYASIDSGKFLLKFKVLSEYVRKEPSVLSDMKKFPGYRDRLDSDKYSYFDTPRSFGQEVDMIMIHRGLIQTHFKVTNPLAEPPVSWWLALEILHWITTRFNALFVALEKPHVTISQQGIKVANLAEECITHLRAQIRTEKNSGVKTRVNELISDDGRVVLIKSGMLDFVMDSSTLACELVKNGGAATVHATTERLAAGAANMIASLVELSIHLKKQHAACIKHPGNHAVEVTDALPPVLPHELARLNPTEFIELLQANKVASRGFLNEGDIKIVCDEHEMLRHRFAEVADFKSALQSCAQNTRFGVAWGLTGGRYKCLEAFAGGLATVLPSDAINLSDASLGDLVLCPEDTEESRLLFANLEMESALHAQQFQPLIKFQEEMYDMLLDEKRTRKRMKTSVNTK